MTTPASVTPDQLARATRYPYGPPATSFLFVNGRGYPLRTDAGDPLSEGAANIGQGFVPVGAALAALGADGVPDSAQRTPVLAYGSNTSVYGLDRKYEDFYGTGRNAVVIPARRVWLADFDVVYSPHLSRWGTVPATLARSPGTRVAVFVLDLAPRELVRMHAIEVGGGNYAYGGLAAPEVARAISRTDEYVSTYLSTHGVLDVGAGPLALGAAVAEGRRFPALDGAAISAAVATFAAPELDHMEFLARVLADSAFRTGATHALKRRARPALGAPWFSSRPAPFAADVG